MNLDRRKALAMLGAFAGVLMTSKVLAQNDALARAAKRNARLVQRHTRGSATDDSWVGQARELAKWQSRFEVGSFRGRSGMILPYRIARPSVATPRPLVLVLHGTGEMGTDNQNQLTPFATSWVRLHEDDPEVAPIIVAPQFSLRSADYEMCGGIRCASRPGPSFDTLLEFLDSFATSDAVDPSRIYVIGFSMGGATAFLLALERPRLAAAIAVFGAVPPPKHRAPELRKENLLVVQGTRDRNHSIDVMREWIDHLNASGGRATLDVREGMKHQVPDDMVVGKTWRMRLLQQRRDKGTSAKLPDV